MAAEKDIETTALSFHNMHEHGALLVNLLKARRNSFIVKNKWALPESDGLEYDQYDNPSSRWIAVHQGSKVLAGIRLTPTTARCGMYSYMIRDAQLGLVNTIPSNLLDFEAPVDPDIWESSRVFVVSDVPSRLRTRVQTMMMRGLIQAAAENGAKKILGLVPAVWSRWIGRLGLKAEPAGPVLEIDGWRTQVALMHLEETKKPAVDIKVRRDLTLIRNPNPKRPQGGMIRRSHLRKNQQSPLSSGDTPAE